MAKSYRENIDSDIKKQLVPVNRIIPFSAVDGPGNRTAIFLQGCNIDCKYCHNPETRGLCNGCGACVVACPVGALSMQESSVYYDKTKCIDCDTCINTCTFDSSPKIEWLDAEAVFIRIKKQLPFISGITVSGGECMLYPEFLQELFGLCKKEKLSTLIDSNGTIDFKKYEDLLKDTDGVMLDVKSYFKEDSINITGFNNEMVLSNLKYLAENKKLEEIRTVVVQELFEPKSVIINTGNILKEIIDIRDIRYKLIAYRSFGVRKQYQCYKTPTEETMKLLKVYAQEIGFKEVIVI